MADTPRLALPLLDGGQAQKHVTVNEALTRLDVFGAAQALSRSIAAPPPEPTEGDLYVAPPSAGGAWVGLDGRLVAWANGGWIDAAPEPGRSLWIADEARSVSFDGAVWLTGCGTLGAATEMRVLTVDHAVAPGTVSIAAAFIPDKAIVLGVTGRVLSTLNGVGAWRLGVDGAPDRYGARIGAEAGSWVQGVTGQPQAYYGATALRLEAESGAFSGGTVRLAAHILFLTPPRLP